MTSNSYDVFLSFVGRDKALATKFADGLRRCGYRVFCYLDHYGDEYLEEMMVNKIAESECVLFLLTNNVRTDPGYMLFERGSQRTQEKRAFTAWETRELSIKGFEDSNSTLSRVCQEDFTSTTDYIGAVADQIAVFLAPSSPPGSAPLDPPPVSTSTYISAQRIDLEAERNCPWERGTNILVPFGLNRESFVGFLNGTTEHDIGGSLKRIEKLIAQENAKLETPIAHLPHREWFVDRCEDLSRYDAGDPRPLGTAAESFADSFSDGSVVPGLIIEARSTTQLKDLAGLLSHWHSTIIASPGFSNLAVCVYAEELNDDVQRALKKSYDEIRREDHTDQPIYRFELQESPTPSLATKNWSEINGFLGTEIDEEGFERALVVLSNNNPDASQIVLAAKNGALSNPESYLKIRDPNVLPWIAHFDDQASIPLDRLPDHLRQEYGLWSLIRMMPLSAPIISSILRLDPVIRAPVGLCTPDELATIEASPNQRSHCERIRTSALL